MWWGTAAFILIEGMTLTVTIGSYFYLSRNFASWPPERTLPPALGIPTVNVVLVVLSMIPQLLTSRAGERLDEERTRRWLLVSLVVSTIVLALRFLEFPGLHTRWDSHAYGSIVWATLVLHTTLVLTDWADTLMLAVIFVIGRAEKKHFAGAVDNATYWGFVVVSWVAVYVVVFLSPRVM
jgi:heme/copper-type cytochrome/quinol oxidase subunit 3